MSMTASERLAAVNEKKTAVRKDLCAEEIAKVETVLDEAAELMKTEVVISNLGTVYAIQPKLPALMRYFTDLGYTVKNESGINPTDTAQLRFSWSD